MVGSLQALSVFDVAMRCPPSSHRHLLHSTWGLPDASPNLFLPQGLCTQQPYHLECVSFTPPLCSFRSWFKCYPLWQPLLLTPSELLSPSTSFIPCFLLLLLSLQKWSLIVTSVSPFPARLPRAPAWGPELSKGQVALSLGTGTAAWVFTSAPRLLSVWGHSSGQGRAPWAAVGSLAGCVTRGRSVVLAVEQK